MTGSHASTVRHFSKMFADGPGVRGFLHTPAKPNGDGLVLAHGAGSNAETPLLAGLAEELAAAGFVALRFELPFRQLRPHGPPGPGDAQRDRDGLKRALGVLREFAPGRIFAAGHSYGGRQASMLVADEPDLAHALLLLSYPLHPPRRKQELRTGHFPRLRRPALFVHGSRDPFGSIEEMKAALALIPAKTELYAVEGAGHDLARARGEIAPALRRFLE